MLNEKNLKPAVRLTTVTMEENIPMVRVTTVTTLQEEVNLVDKMTYMYAIHFTVFL